MGAGLATIPFDAVRGVSALGELGNELSFPFFASAVLCLAIDSVRQGHNRLRDSLALRIGGLFLLVILLSFAANAGEITTGFVRGRAALPKFATSLMVVLYGVALAWLAEQVPVEAYRKQIARLVGWSAAIAIAYALFELAGRSVLRAPFAIIDSLVHSRQSDLINSWDGSVNQKVLEGWDQRIRSVSFEPPAFGNYTGFAWPWLWYAAVAAPPGKRLLPWLLVTAMTLTILLSQSRTGLLMLGANLAGLAALFLLYAQPRAQGEAAAALRLLLPVSAALFATGLAYRLWAQSQGMIDEIVLGDSVSNLSRLGFQAAGLTIFQQHPLFGVGLGQFGFHVLEALPSWAFLSSEVRPMVTFPEAPWPNVYSLYVRLAAELGIVGLVGWLLLWPALFLRVATYARGRADQVPELRFAAYPVALNCLGVLASGIASDTFRTPMIWITLGAAAALVRATQPMRGSSASRSVAA
jgi:uncharacterized integral membrane protein